MPTQTRAVMLMEAGGLSFATASYRNFDSRWGLPVRITVGHPRGFRHPLAGNLQQLAPDRAWLHLNDPDEFTKLYVDKLETELGPYPMLKLYELAWNVRLANKKRKARLVFCCFEAPGEFCHRRVLASWLERFGLTVPELTKRECS